MNTKFFLAFLILILLNSPSLFAVDGDNCDQAIELTVGTSCTMELFNSSGATSEPTSVCPNPSCGFYQGGDVWFTVLVPSSGELRIERTNVTPMQACVAIYTGVCGGFTEYECLNGTPAFNAITISDPALANTTLYVRVYRFNNSSGGSFNLCAFDPVIPTNNECDDAIDLTVGATCSLQTFSNQYATGSSGVPAPNCGFYNGGDVWITVTVPASGKLRIERTNTSGWNIAIAIYTGTCGDLTLYDCKSSSTTNTVINFTINRPDMAGQVLYLRAYTYNNYDGGGFSLCAYEPIVPSNDFCSDAIPLTVQSTCNMMTFTNVLSTGFEYAANANPTCGFFAGGDVWFSVVVPSSGHLRIERQSVSGSAAQLSLYTGTCGSLTEIVCKQGTGNNAYITLHDESLAGATLLLRVYGFNNPEGGIFNLCAWEPDIPDNDFCANAIPLTVGTSCNMQSFSNAYCTATEPLTTPNPSCGFYAGGDIWFTFQYPESGHFRIERLDGNIYSAQFALYQGSCGSLDPIECVQNSNSTSIVNMHVDSLAGQWLYLRIFSYNSSEGGTFSICLWEPDMPDNDFCDAAIPLEVGSDCVLQTYNNLYCTGWEEMPVPSPTCGFYAGGDSWYTFVFPQSGHLRIERNNHAGSNIQFALYTGTCGNLVQVRCAQNLNALNVHDDQLAGQTIYLRVYNSNDPIGGTFDMCLWEPDIPDNDFCSFAEDIVLGEPCQPDTVSALYCTSGPEVVPGPSCVAFLDTDIWYRLLVPDDGIFTLNINSISNGAGDCVIYEGNCDGLSELVCLYNQSTYEFSDALYAGETLYLRFFSGASQVSGSFSFNVVGSDLPCAGDFDNNGVIATSDLLLFMAAFGDTVPCGGFDIDGNSNVNTSDLLLLMANFGSSCE
ncbi:MAG: hypothetical protein JNM00_12535 [Flavobacteriales bacterium]|nr:hypothetical protein [Flavobacteriales bacterium]